MNGIAGLSVWSCLGIISAAFAHGHGLLVGMAAFLAHVCAHQTGEQGDAVLAGFEANKNNDLEFAFAHAYLETLRRVKQKLPGNLLNADIGAALDRWIAVLAKVKTRDDAKELFLPGEAADPVDFEVDGNAWTGVRTVLLRSTDESEIPTGLDAYLRKNFEPLVKEVLKQVVRTKEHEAGWIAWQQSFFKATYQEARRSNQALARVMESLARQDDQLGVLLDKVDDVRVAVAGVSGQVEDVITLLTQTSAKREPTAADIAAYLTALRTANAHIDLKNLRTRDGSANPYPIEELYTPLTTVLAQPSDGKERAHDRMERAEPIPLHQALRERRLVIVGDPGAGKTTFLRRIAFEACRARTGETRGIERLLDDPAPFPIFIKASALAAHVAAANKPAPLAAKTSHEWLIDYLGDEYKPLGADYFRGALKNNCLLLVDGLDEIPGEMDRTNTADILKTFALQEAYQGAQVVVTSRPGVYGGITTIQGLATVRIAPLDDPAIKVFTTKWGQAVYREDAAAADRLSTQLRGEIHSKKEIRELAGTPVMLTALACLHFTAGPAPGSPDRPSETRLPEQRSELYKAVLEWLAKSRQTAGRDYTTLLAEMRTLAWEMHAGQPDKRNDLERDKAIDVLLPDFQGQRDVSRQREAVGLFLEQEEVKSGIIVNRGHMLRFWHPTFQEYLAAAELCLDPAKRQKYLFEKGKAYDPLWRETVLLLAGQLASPRLRNQLLSDVLKNGATRIAPCVGLMGALLKDLEAWKYEMPAAIEEKWQAARTQALSVFDAEQARAIPFDIRLDAAEALGREGDPRLLRDNWVRVQGGEFWMGAQKTDPHGRNYDPDAYDNERLRQEQVAPFDMGKYPVTVAEYKQFVEADGYRKKQYWDAGELGKFSEPDGWESQLQHSNRPVTGVSWWEASAYCAWKGNGVRLPSEVEWECAARDGLEGVRYPWGPEKPDATRANYDYNDSPGEPTPVGLYPAGVTPSGIHDLAGNVLEWTTSSYEVSDSTRVVRGGSWVSYPEWLRVSYRGWRHPVYRGGSLGFRCAREVKFPS